MNIITKKCTRCTEHKSITEFGNFSKSKDGKLTICKECNRKRNKLYREKISKEGKKKKKTPTLDVLIKVFEKKTGQDFRKFYEKYLPKLIYHNTKYLRGDVQVAQDVAIDSIMRSLEKIDVYDPEKARFSTWLFTISKHESIQTLNKINKSISMDKCIDEEGTTIKDFISDSSFEDEKVKEIESLSVTKGNILKEKIEKLKTPYKEVIKLREIQHKSYRDITIILREKEIISIDNKTFNRKNYKKNVLSLVDPEKKESNQLIKFYSIDNVTDIEGNEVEYRVVDRDRDGLISQIEIEHKGDFLIEGEVPFNMSTLKSQIRNGRLILQSMVEKDFELLDKMYL